MGLLEYHQNPCSRLVSEECDVILMLGEKLVFPLNQGTAPLFSPESSLISVNATSRELSSNMLADVRIASDIRAFIEALDKSSDVNEKDEEWVRKIRETRKKSLKAHRGVLDDFDGPIHPLRLLHDVLSCLREKDILVVDGGDIACWAEIAINFGHLRDDHSEVFLRRGLGSRWGQAQHLQQRYRWPRLPQMLF